MLAAILAPTNFTLVISIWTSCAATAPFTYDVSATAEREPASLDLQHDAGGKCVCVCVRVCVCCVLGVWVCGGVCVCVCGCVCAWGCVCVSYKNALSARELLVH